MKRFQWYNWNGDNGYIKFSEIIDLSRLYLKTGFRCHYCGAKMCIADDAAYNNCSIEHRISLVAGGKNEVENLLLCCQACNNIKG
jgi:5-methylcytosine-specific restriction endonuclease McrA